MSIKTRDERRSAAIQDAVRKATRKPGQTMPNGAVIIESRFSNDYDEYGEEHIVLAVVEGAFEPYVTWKRCIGISETAGGGYQDVDYCVNGHYFRNLDEAVEDYRERRY